MFDQISLPQNWRRNPGFEARLVRPLCIEHKSLTAFIDVAPPECTEGLYEWPEAVAVAKLYLPHNRFEGFVCRSQLPIFKKTEAEQVIEELARRFEEQNESG
jgi:hypothetical protein